MGALTKVRDLAGRAGRWLGRTTPPAPATRAIEADRFDQMEWREVLDQAAALQDMTTDLGQSHDYAADLLADVWTAAYKTTPRLRDKADLDPSRQVNHQVCAGLLNAPEFAELRRDTVGDPYASALAVISQRDRLTRLLDQAEDAQHAAEQAQDAHQAAADAAQQVDQALQHAAADADEDGTVPDDAAQAVEEAIEQAEQADQDAAAADQAARLALAAAAPGMRVALRAAAADAADQVRADKALMAAWGVTPGQLQRMDYATRADLAKRLRTGRLGKFADLIGRFRQMATGERTRKLEGAPGELVGITLGDDVGRLIPSELASLGVPALRAAFAARLAENRLMVYETRGDQTAGKGAIIACVDCSGSMGGWGRDNADRLTGEAWAKACALALLDQARAARPRRDFIGILFASAHELKVFHFPADRPVAITDVADFAEHFFNGGTDFAAPLDAAADILHTQFTTAGATRGDIVLITDGESEVTEDWMRAWHDRKHQLGFRTFGIHVDTTPSWRRAHTGDDGPGPVLEALSDNLHTITDLADPGTTRDLFRVI